MTAPSIKHARVYRLVTPTTPPQPDDPGADIRAALQRGTEGHLWAMFASGFGVGFAVMFLVMKLMAQ